MNQLLDPLKKIKQIEFLGKGYRNTIHLITFQHKSEKAILITFKDTTEIINRVNRISKDLYAQGLKNIRIPYGEKNLYINKKTKRYHGLFTYITGETLEWDSFTRKHIKEVGINLANFHNVGNKVDNTAYLPDAIKIQLAQLHKALDYLSRSNVQNALKVKLSISLDIENIRRNLLKYFAKINTKTQHIQTVLHMDFVRGNLLFNGSELTGIIDLEKVCYGPRFLDISRTLAFLITDSKTKTPNQVYKALVLSGYNKNTCFPLNSTELFYIKKHIYPHLLYDLYKFLKHNPYENLKQNLHFNNLRETLKI